MLKKEDYLEEMRNLLSDRHTYKILKKDPTDQYKKLLNQLVQEGFRKGLINEKEKDFLIPLALRIPIIYYLPKVHKDPLKPPGRTIVSGIDSITSRIGKFIDHFLQPLVTKTTAFLKDSRQIINKISAISIESDVLLVTADVSSLYTIIPHQIGYMAARYFLNKDQSIKKPLKEFVLKLLEFAMEHSYFYFGGEFYLQCTGVAMGAKFAPSLANLFMALWEFFLFSCHDPHLLFWKRYI